VATEEEDELGQVYQDIRPSLTDKDSRKFFPWHKPRKHYLRIHQWCNEIQKLINLSKYQEGDVLHYLGFPGEDFLDLHVLKGVCDRAKVKLRYLGFDRTASYAGRDSQFHLNKHDVFKLGFIQAPSYVLKDDFCVLANIKSIAYQKTLSFHQFDIINIDLCDSIASPTDVEYPPYFEAIKRLCDMQVRGRTKPWVLFLTTRAVRDQIDTKTKQKLFNCVLSNIQDHSDFATALNNTLSLDDGKIKDEISDASPLDHTTLVNLFGLAIGKWLIQMMEEAVPKPRVGLLKSYSYRVETKETKDPDMLSLAFLFEPQVATPVDKSGLTPSNAGRIETPDERQLAIDLLNKIREVTDIDSFLHANEETHTKMTDKCGELLKAVHYDMEEYRKWVEKNRWIPEGSCR
jgi:hypothetical protein